MAFMTTLCAFMVFITHACAYRPLEEDMNHAMRMTEKDLEVSQKMIIDAGYEPGLDAYKYSKEYNFLKTGRYVDVYEAYYVRNSGPAISQIKHYYDNIPNNIEFFDDAGNFLNKHHVSETGHLDFYTRHDILPYTSYAYRAEYKYLRQQVVTNLNENEIILRIDILPKARVDRVLDTKITIIIPQRMSVKHLKFSKNIPTTTNIETKKARKGICYFSLSTIYTITIPNTVVDNTIDNNQFIEIICNNGPNAEKWRITEEIFSSFIHVLFLTFAFKYIKLLENYF